MLGGANKGYADTFVAAYSADGTLKWIEQPGTTDDDGAVGVAIDTGKIFVIGRQTDSTGMPQGYLAALSDDGAELWRRRFGGTSSDGVYGVAIDAAGNVVIGGTEFYEEFAASYTPTGALQWKLKPSRNIERVFPATDAAGHIVIAGSAYVRPARGYWDAFVAKYASSAP